MADIIYGDINGEVKLTFRWSKCAYTK